VLYYKSLSRPLAKVSNLLPLRHGVFRVFSQCLSDSVVRNGNNYYYRLLMQEVQYLMSFVFRKTDSNSQGAAPTSVPLKQ